MPVSRFASTCVSAYECICCWLQYIAKLLSRNDSMCFVVPSCMREACLPAKNLLGRHESEAGTVSADCGSDEHSRDVSHDRGCVLCGGLLLRKADCIQSAHRPGLAAGGAHFPRQRSAARGPRRAHPPGPLLPALHRGGLPAACGGHGVCQHPNDELPCVQQDSLHGLTERGLFQCP